MDRPGGRSDSEQMGSGDMAAPVWRSACAPDADRDARWAAWQMENAGAIDAWNAYVEEHGLPLAELHQP